MKTTTFALGALSLASLAVAVPSGHRQHQQLHEKRERQVFTKVEYVTAALPDVVVYVDEKGRVLSTVTAGQTATAAASSAATSAVVEPTSVYVAPTTIAVASSAVAATSAAPSAAATSASGSAPEGYGITYSPYNADGTCKTQGQVNSDFNSLSGYSFVRSYGTDCNQAETILKACRAKGLKLMAGVYDITQVTSSIQAIIAAANGDWSDIQTVSIGNEGVNNGAYTVSAVVSAVNTARSLLTAAGYTGNVVTVDTFVAIIANPELCQVSDYAAANAHPFFDGGVTADKAGPWLLEQMQRVSNACGGKETWITETGWPTQGNTNGKAVPSVENQKAAISSIKSTVSSNVILFTAFNDMWKKAEAATFYAEQYWGMIH